MDIYWDKTAWEDYQYWVTNDRKILRKINALIKECQRTPFVGTGKPEALKQNLSGFWSRRITGEHRLVYKVENDVLYIAQCRYHY
ncbi:Txe/YoeB family addiction module toxin [Sunxiuqinia dokdonensis]|uniref:Putative mRNA interferase YoeB n=1 Tax=Sunxiuqinia dokdonensis TaxID=1409788 RepID=A0A0L8VF15_9BACT|nr:Txe/YoeB family addiction module toxin [Sunxiuqinia dokdonensis]KOH47054.1 toxin YoeB [Sunxiuqinia dokdonensis]